MAEEFDEEEVWDTTMEKRIDSPKARKQKNSSFSSHPASMHMPRPKVVAEQSRRSSPVNIPKWSKIHKGSTSLDACDDGGRKADSEEEDDDDKEKFPPHEMLARKMARSQISSSSVCEGEGRTLKGRDQRKVRDAVLTRTGFLE